MTFRQVRNTITEKLEEHLGVPVDLSDQIIPVREFPFAFYSVISPYIPNGEMGNYTHTPNEGATTVTTTRREQPTATLSFTFCSINRDDGNGGQIFGEDEAQSLAEKAQGFFLVVGRNILSNLGVVVVEITNAAPRTTLVVGETARRYGFDLKVRYTRTDSRIDETIGRVTTVQVKE